MKWSGKLGRIAGIDVYVHATFGLLVAWIGVTQYLERKSVLAALDGVGFILALFACVVLHELGHALTARHFGIATRDITLLPIGGVARLERMPDDPKQELLVAVAGPVVSLAIACALFAITVLTYSPAALASNVFLETNFIAKLMVVNGMLVAFNLLPAFPMDGGRVLRAILAQRMPYVRATQIAAGVGQGMAMLFGFVGLLYNPFLLFIALFVYMGAAQEASVAQMRAAFAGIPVGRAMVTDFHSLSPGDPLQRAVDLMLAGYQQDFPVVQDGQLVGVLMRTALLSGLSRFGPAEPVETVMTTSFRTLDAGEMLDIGFRKLQECECSSLPVLQGGLLVGIISPRNIGEFVMVQSALMRNRRNGRAA